MATYTTISDDKATFDLEKIKTSIKTREESYYNTNKEAKDKLFEQVQWILKFVKEVNA